jgi:hypothetical protein
VAEQRRVVITGIGALTPIGITRDALWHGLREARSAVRSITRFDPGSAAESPPRGFSARRARGETGPKADRFGICHLRALSDSVSNIMGSRSRARPMMGARSADWLRRAKLPSTKARPTTLATNARAGAARNPRQSSAPRTEQHERDELRVGHDGDRRGLPADP